MRFVDVWFDERLSYSTSSWVLTRGLVEWQRANQRHGCSQRRINVYLEECEVGQSRYQRLVRTVIASDSGLFCRLHSDSDTHVGLLMDCTYWTAKTPKKKSGQYDCHFYKIRKMNRNAG